MRSFDTKRSVAGNNSTATNFKNKAGDAEHTALRSQVDFSFLVQPKLTINQPGDRYEQEADAMADKIMRKEKPGYINSISAISQVQRKCAHCEEEENQVQRKESSITPATANINLNSYVGGLNNGGKSLPASLRSFYEPHFNYDFSQVRIHADNAAAQSAQSINALAYTTGNNIVFNRGQYAPETEPGKRLLGHELTHVVQQNNMVNRKAPDVNNTDELHEELIEQYRQANGWPPHGIDTVTQQPVGPTDADIKYGGLLDAWLTGKAPAAKGTQSTPNAQSTQSPQGGQGTKTTTPPATPPQTTKGSSGTQIKNIPPPQTPPTLKPVGAVNTAAACTGKNNTPECNTHQFYVQNILPQAIDNIRAVTSPYSKAIADMYASALKPAQAAAVPSPGSVNAKGGPVTINIGTVSHTFTDFTITLEQRAGGVNGQAFNAGLGPKAYVTLNEMSKDAQSNNQAGIEETMVHEGMHLLMEIIEATNQANRKAGNPVTSPTLDRATYASMKTGLELILLTHITKIRQLPEFVKSPPPLTAAQDASATADSLLSETIARTEAAIFKSQRMGQGFTAKDISTIPVFTNRIDYWSPTPPNATARMEMENYINTNLAGIVASLQTHITKASELYIDQRP